jgi:hypothetical protein
MHKFESSNPTWGNAGIYHLDKIFDCNCSAYQKLLHRCSEIKQSTSSTLFIFLSPQFLINHPDALGVFITGTQERMLWLIAMDEVHIHMTGCLFVKKFVLFVLIFSGLYKQSTK